MSDMREAFERSVVATWGNRLSLKKDDAGYYIDDKVDGMWRGWKARDRFGSDSEKPNSSDHVADVSKMVDRDGSAQGAEPVGIVRHRTDPRGDNPDAYVEWQFGGDVENIPDGTELYTQSQPAQRGSVPEGVCPHCKGKGRHVIGPADCPAVKVCQLCSAAPQPEGDCWVKCNKQDLVAVLGNLQYAGFNLCRKFDFSRIQRPGRRTTESTCPEDSLLIAIRDLCELIGEPLPQPPQEDSEHE